MNRRKMLRRITYALLGAVLLGGIILLAHLLQPVPELSFDSAAGLRRIAVN